MSSNSVGDIAVRRTIVADALRVEHESGCAGQAMSLAREANHSCERVCAPSTLILLADAVEAVVIVHPTSNTEEIWRGWWQKEYGCTPEESIASR